MNSGPRLIQCLMDSVKHCQIRHGGKQSLATGNESVVCCLCQQLENILLHGLRQRPVSTIKQMCGAVINSLNLPISVSDGQASVLWQLVAELVPVRERERFLLLKHVSTDLGRARAWLRSALNEASLARYLHLLVSRSDVIDKFYESDALMADSELSSMLPNVVAGLDEIIFAIVIDNAELDCAARGPVSRSSAAGAAAAAAHKPGSAAHGGDCGAPLAVVTCGRAIEIRSDRVNKAAHARSAERKRLRRSHIAGSSGPCSAPTAPYELNRRIEHIIEQGSQPVENDSTEQTNSSCSSSDSDSDSVVSVEQPERWKDLQTETAFSRLSLQHQQIETQDSNGDFSSFSPGGAATDVNTCANEFASNDRPSSPIAIPLKSCPIEPDHTNAEALASAPDGFSLDFSQAENSIVSLSEDDLRKALEAIYAVKCSLTTQVATLSDKLASALEQNSQLRSSKVNSESCLEAKIVRLENDRIALQSENSTLKRQLMRYVTAVRVLDSTKTCRSPPPSDGPPTTSSADTDPSQHVPSAASAADVCSNSSLTSVYQEKLIQIAEMHAELIDYNAVLQRRLAASETRAEHMTSQLQRLGLLYPDPSSCSRSDCKGTSTPSCSGLLAAEPLTQAQLWVPDVFLSEGSATRPHHVYQVYVRVGIDEWSVYHRYSAFRRLYRRLAKISAQINSFHFPAKQTFNRPDYHLAETRRQQLQQFLRAVLRHVISSNLTLSTCPSKTALIQAESFFGTHSSRTADFNNPRIN